MALTASTTNTGEDYALLTAGVQPARLVGIIDLGTQTSTFEGKSK
jgi:hypothetical protein